jgi:hypothetical protein
VRQRDDNNTSRSTVPYQRPLLLLLSKNLPCVQRDARSDGFMHNHPSGDPTPSQADIQMTRAIVDIATPLGISVHDHIIVGKKGHASMKGMRLM